MSDEKARYRVLELSFIDSRLVQPGEEIEYDGHPGDNLQPLNDAAEQALDYYVNVAEPERIRKLIEANSTPGTSAFADPAAFAEALAKATAAQGADINKQISEGIAAAFALFFPQGLNKPPVQPAPAAPAGDLT